MSTQRAGISGTRILLVLGVVLLVGAAWFGGRVTAPATGSHMAGMGGMMRGGDTTAPSGQPFEGEEGADRCRAMMGAMEDIHRSMRAMMARHHGDQSASGSSDRDSRMGRGMMDGQMGPGSGSMEARGSRMAEGMSMEKMRRLCRTMQSTMEDVTQRNAPVETGGPGGEQVSGNLDLEAQTEEWLGSTRGFETIEDRTGESEVVVKVGAGTGLSYAPAAVRVDPGTTIRWQWTGNGGLHNVAFVGTEVNTPLRGEQGETFTYTFTEPGEYRYECTPHAAVGMRGVVIVEAR